MSFTGDRTKVPFSSLHACIWAAGSFTLLKHLPFLHPPTICKKFVETTSLLFLFPHFFLSLWASILKNFFSSGSDDRCRPPPTTKGTRSPSCTCWGSQYLDQARCSGHGCKVTSGSSQCTTHFVWTFPRAKKPAVDVDQCFVDSISATSQAQGLSNVKAPL